MNRQYTKEDLQDMRLHYMMDFMEPFNLLIYKNSEAISINNDSIELSWNDVTDAKGYNFRIPTGELITVDYNNK